MSASPALHAPLPYDETCEDVAPDEVEVIAAINEELLKIARVVCNDTGHAMRAVHAKGHGLLRGRMTVEPGLTPPLAQGIFREPRSYPVLLRLSTSAGDVLPDSVSLPRGLALKVYDVPGERLEGSEGETTQDFLFVDAPAFVAPDARHFLKSLRLLAHTTDKAAGLKKVLSAALRGAEQAAEALGHESATLRSLGGHPLTHILGETYHTQVPLLHGRYMAKLSLVPGSDELRALQGTTLGLAGQPDGLRDAIRQFFRAHGGEWLLRAQLCTDLQRMPIEDASVAWSEAESPHRPVARIVCPPQDTWDDALGHDQEDRLYFSPWRGVAEHRPLGSVMRARRYAYRVSAGFRRDRNAPPPEPETARTHVPPVPRDAPPWTT
ncbi:MAG: catalase family protein [Proteobacteria bacterium]|nr:catalase family protein [Pseudomonadota bacterium]